MGERGPLRFRKKPIIIEAVRVPIEGMDSEEEFMVGHGIIAGWMMHRLPNAMITECKGYLIPTLEGTMQAFPGDWIIRGVQGEFYPCKSDIFEATYERVASHAS